jgi:hypothetical protein
MIRYWYISSWNKWNSRRRYSAVLGFFVLLGLTGCGTSTPSQTQLPILSPVTPTVTATPLAQVEPPRTDSAMAYDVAQHTLVLFGGILSSGQMTNETWAWNGKEWSQLHPASSPPALQGIMTYDAASAQIILLLYQVQSGGVVANEMWAWDGATWQQLHPPAMPEVIGASLAYDATRRQVVLFGGGVPNGHLVTYSNATWTWDGTTWRQQHPAAAPQPRTGAAMAYDSARQQMVLYGGSGQSSFADIWTWDGTTWRQQHPALMPPARQQASLVYDDVTQQVILFGGIGLSDQQSLSDTWVWNGSGWTEAANQGAPADSFESAAYDPDQQEVVVYAVQGNTKASPPSGASSPVSQTWAWNGSMWVLLG